MKKLIFSLILSIILVPASAKNLKITSLPENNWVWNKTEAPSLTFHVCDTSASGGVSEFTIDIKGDRQDRPVCYSEKRIIALPGNASVEMIVKPSLPGPGFYKVNVRDDDNDILSYNIGISPEEVISLPDSQPDLASFWQKAIEELSAVPMNATMVEIPEKSGEKRKLYFCQFLSLDNDTVSGYLALPIKEGKYPAIIYYNGYNGQPWDIDPDGMSDWIEFQHWVRGQGPNKPYNRYDEYALYHLENPEEYYYRGAYMDALRTIDFIESLPQTDTEAIFAEGGSQGGAFTFVAAALDPGKRLKGIAPYIPFMSDFPDYFEIVNWPGDMAKAKAVELGMTPEEMYRNLSYFDIKNLTPRITVPVLMGAGLQDKTCPPHTNFSGYNNLTIEDKEYIIYPLCGHTVDYKDWNPRRLEFFNRIRK